MASEPKTNRIYEIFGRGGRCRTRGDPFYRLRLRRLKSPAGEGATKGPEGRGVDLSVGCLNRFHLATLTALFLCFRRYSPLYFSHDVYHR